MLNSVSEALPPPFNTLFKITQFAEDGTYRPENGNGRPIAEIAGHALLPQRYGIQSIETGEKLYKLQPPLPRHQLSAVFEPFTQKAESDEKISEPPSPTFASEN